MILDYGRMLDYWEMGGPLMVPIVATSIGIWFYFLRSRLELRAVTGTPPEFERDIATRVMRQPLPEVAAECRVMRGALAAAVAYALDAESHHKLPEAAYMQYEKAAIARLGRDLVVLTALTTAAPLLGLLGTVGGMMETFQGVAAAGDAGSRVTGGVSQALVTTQFGLVAAIPGVLLVARVQRLLDRVEVRFANCHSHLRVALAARASMRGGHATVA